MWPLRSQKVMPCEDGGFPESVALVRIAEAKVTIAET